MLKVLRNYAHYAYFLPGLLLLLFGMLALHTSVRLSDQHEKLDEKYHALVAAAHDLPSFVQEDKEILELEENIEKLHTLMYWSVIAISLSGFLLLVLNADKLSRLERLNAEKRKALQDLQYRSVAMEASMEGIGLVDRDGNLTYMNPALRNLHGIQPEESWVFLGKSWLNLYTPKGRDLIVRNVLPVLEDKGFWRGISPIVRQGGEILRAEMSLTKLPDGGFIGTARDISDEEKAEEEKRIITEQLYQAQKMEAVGRLAGGIAHDFNNILAAINGYAEFLVEDLGAETAQHGFASNILQAGRQARALVDKILAFSRRKGNDVDYIDLKVPLDESISLLSATMPKSIELETKFEIDNAPIKGNASQMAQMIMNLCVNARDAMEHDKGTLFLGLRKVFSTDESPLEWLSERIPDAEGVPLIRMDDIGPGHTRLLLGQMAKDHEYVCLSVEDSGTGMSRAIMEHIFEPFFTTKPVDKGTGLGLATVHGVIAGHAGAMMINSKIGRGTRFDIFLPLEQGVSFRNSSDVAGEIRGGGETILLVEDQDQVRAMTEDMLKRLGYSVQSAANGMEALDVLRENKGQFAIVLSDHNMPKMTGLELVYQAHFDFPDLPFVLFSGYSQERLQEMMDEHAAIKAVLRKPVSQAVLSQTLKDVIAASAGRKAA